MTLFLANLRLVVSFGHNAMYPLHPGCDVTFQITFLNRQSYQNAAIFFLKKCHMTPWLIPSLSLVIFGDTVFLRVWLIFWMAPDSCDLMQSKKRKTNLQFALYWKKNCSIVKSNTKKWFDLAWRRHRCIENINIAIKHFCDFIITSQTL